MLLRLVAARPHVLVAEIPGGTAVRLTVEAELRRRGWPAAAHPADADVLVVVGPVGARWSPYVDRVWCQVPAPRVRLDIADARTVPTELDDAAARLAAGGDAAAAGGPVEAGDRENPSGLAMVDRGDDRDGLALDRLHVPFGPLLADWPAGLVVRTTMQGDVIQDARCELIPADGPAEAFWTEPWRRGAAGGHASTGDAARRDTAAHLDSLGRLLAVAGWRDAALRSRRLRDELLAGTPGRRAQPQLRRLARKLRGSRTLRWLADDDVTARWQGWLAAAEQTMPNIDAPGSLRQVEHPAARSADAGPELQRLSGLLEGRELGAARVTVASLDPELGELAVRQPIEVADG